MKNCTEHGIPQIPKTELISALPAHPKNTHTQDLLEVGREQVLEELLRRLVAVNAARMGLALEKEGEAS